MRQLLLVLLFAAGLVVAGCSTQAPTPTPEIFFGNVATEAVGTPVTAEALQGTHWAWSSLFETEPAAQSVVPTPEQYTIFFGADGTLEINADCNVGSGTYVVRGNGTLVIETGPFTMAFCGEESLDQQYLQLLGQVTSGAFQGASLNLTTNTGATMTFAPVQVITLNPDGVTLDTQGLPYTWDAQIVRSMPYDDTQPSGPSGLPVHIQVNFIPTDSAAAQAPAPVMYIIPVEAYKTLWNEAGNAGVSETMAQIFQFASTLPYPGPVSGLPVLPFEQATGRNDLAVQQGRIPADATSATKDGYRFVGRFAGNPEPVTNQGLRYIYQGFSSDADYLVAFFAPVRTDALADSVERIPHDELARASDDYAGYIQERATVMNRLIPAAWQPDLTTLDALVASLTINGMAENAAIGYVWHAISGATTPGGDQSPIAEPHRYSLTLYPDGSYDYVADCNTGSGTFGITGGMTGSIGFSAGSSTLAECGPGSAFDLFVNTLAASQTFRVHPGGSLLELVRPAGGGSLFLINAGPADPVLPEPQPPIALPTPESSVPTGTVIAVDGVNIRSGPGTVYPIIGFAPSGATGTLIGRSFDGLWWVASAPSLPGGVAWVAAAYVRADNAEGLPVIQAPAPPAPVVTPTPEPTPAPVISLTADTTTINQGECTTLRWDVQNVAAVYVYPLGDDYKKYPEAGQSAREVCPANTTTYEMRVELTNGQLELRQVTVTVEVPSDPLADTNWALVSMMVNQVPVPGTALTISFDGSGGVAGFTGCNDLNGIYTQSGNTLIIGGLTLTQKLCPDDVMLQEQSYVSALQAVSAYQLTAGQLVLFDATGQETLRYIGFDTRDE